MMRLTGVEFVEQSIEVDGHEYVGCEFTRCQMILTGLGPCIHMTGNHLDHCAWTLDGPALRTITFLSFLYRDGNASVIEGLFQQIRTGAFLPPPA